MYLVIVIDWLSYHNLFIINVRFFMGLCYFRKSLSHIMCRIPTFGIGMYGDIFGNHWRGLKRCYLFRIMFFCSNSTIWIYTTQTDVNKRCETAGSWRVGGFLCHLPTVYLFLSRLFALRRKRQSMIKLPCNKCNGCVSSSSHKLKSAGALLMQLRSSLDLPVAPTTSGT